MAPLILLPLRLVLLLHLLFTLFIFFLLVLLHQLPSSFYHFLQSTLSASLSLSQPMIAGKWASHFPRFYTEGSMLMIATHRWDSLPITFLSIVVIKSSVHSVRKQ